MKTFILPVAVVGVVLLPTTITLGEPITIFSDDFQSSQNASNLTAQQVTTNPHSPPPIGQSWSFSETNASAVGMEGKALDDPADSIFMTFDNNATGTATGNLTTQGQNLVESYETVTLSFRLRRFSSSGQVYAHEFAGMNGAAETFRISLEGGTPRPLDIRYYNPATSSYVDTGLVGSTQEFQDLEVIADFSTHTYSLTVDDSTVTGLPFVDNTLSTITGVQFRHSGGSGSRNHVDDVLVTVPEPSCLASLLAGLLALLGVRRP
jgi:hypothetical protein